MAEKKPEYPVRVPLAGGPDFGPGPLVRVPLDPGNEMGGAYGAAINLRRSAARALENAPSPMSPNPLRTVMPATSALAKLGSQPVRVAVADFFDGLVGNPKGGKKTPVTPDKAVEQAMTQGREALGGPNPIAPVDKQSAMIAAILGSGLTTNEAATLAGILPQTTPAKAPSVKDTVIAEASNVSKQILEQSILDAQKLQAAGKTDAARDVVSKAREIYLAQQVSLAGSNPLQIAQAQLMGGGE